MSSYEDGCSSLEINTFSDTSPLEAPPHTRGICLLGSTGEVEDPPLEAHQALVTKILNEKWDVPLKKDFVGPHLQSSKCQPNESLEAESSGRLSHEQVTEHVGGFRDFYDPMAEYMEGLGKGNDWLHPCFEDKFVYRFLLPLSISFMSIKHHKRTRILGKLLDWLHWKSNFTQSDLCTKLGRVGRSK